MLEDSVSPEEQRDFLQRMRKETERINRILRDLLDFARPGSPVAGPQEPGDVEGAVRDVLALVAPQKDTRDLRLTTSVEPDLPRVTLSREHLVQVVLNLFLNAVDACGKGGAIIVAAKRGGSGVQLVVEDDGPGVAVEIRDRLFEPFATTKEVGKGTGLGLAVCRGLVEASGGTIVLDSSTPKGARFMVDLPPSDQNG
jgi:signal transduction histidine kinase